MHARTLCRRLALIAFVAVTLLPFTPRESSAATLGDFRSTAAGGAWSQTSTWQTYAGGIWIPAVTYPTALDGEITISGPGGVHLDIAVNNITLDQLVINGTLHVDPFVSWTLDEVGGYDMTINTGASVINEGNTLTVVGDIRNDGTWSEIGIGSHTYAFTGAAVELAGGEDFAFAGPVTVSAGADVTQKGRIVLSGPMTVDGAWRLIPPDASECTGCTEFWSNASVVVNGTIEFRGSGRFTGSGSPKITYAVGSTLIVGDDNQTSHTVGREWAEGTAVGLGVPYNVKVVGSGGAVSMPAGARTCAGLLKLNGDDLELNATAGSDLTLLGDLEIVDGRFSANLRAVTFKGTSPQTYSSSDVVDFADITVSTNSTLICTSYMPFYSGILTVNGTLQLSDRVVGQQILINGTLQRNDGADLAFAPFYGPNSFLVWNSSEGMGNEWTTGTTVGSGVPANFTVLGGTCTMPVNDRTCPGDVLLSGGSLVLSPSPNSGLRVGGDWTNSPGAAFHANGRKVTFNGTSPQTLSGTTTFDGFSVVAGSDLILTSPVTLSAGYTPQVDGTLEYGSTLTLNSPLQVDGTLQCNGGSLTGSPTYGPNSFLIFNGTANVGSAWESGPSAGPGVPANFTVTSGTATLPAGARTCPGTLSVTGGTLALSATAGADLSVKGDWTLSGSGALAANGRAVIFTGTVTHTLTGGTSFADLVIDAGATLKLNANINVAGAWTNNGTFTPNGKSVTFNGSAPQTLTGATTFNGFSVPSASTLVLTSPVTLAAGFAPSVAGLLELASALTPSSALSVTGSLQMDAGGSIVTTAPTYGAASTLIYNTTMTPGLEWGNGTAVGVGVPFNVQLNSGVLTLPGSDRTCPGSLKIKNAATLVLSATAGRDLYVGGDWTRNGTFTPNGRKVRFNGTVPQVVDGGTTFDGLTVDNAAGLSLLNNVTVNGSLTLTNGVIACGTKTLTLGSSATTSRTNGWVFGKFVKQVAVGAPSLVFEVGDATRYAPMQLAFASVSVAGTVTGSTTAGDHPNIGSSSIKSTKSVNRYWTLTNSGVTFTTCPTTFTFNAADLDAGAATAAFVIGQYSAATWTTPTVSTRTATSTSAQGLTSFGDFAVGEAATPVAAGDPQFEDAAIPAVTALLPVVSNPVRHATQARFGLHADSHVRLAVYDMRGRLVRSLLSADALAGTHTLMWDTRDALGREVGSGLYVLRLDAGGRVFTRRLQIAR